MKTYYRGHANIGCYQLSTTDCSTGQKQPLNMAPITKMELLFLTTLYDSDTDPDAFDWSVDPSNGRLNLKLGLLAGVPTGRDSKAELVIYDPSNPEGIVQGIIGINMLDKT